MVPAVQVNPATSTSSVGGMWACAIDKCVTIGSFGANRVAPSGNGNWNPSELSNGSPEIAAKRPFHIMLG